MLNNKVILVTGGTGFFGQKFTGFVFERYKPRKLIIFSRDEYKQYEMSKIFPENKCPIRYFLGDVRDRLRLNLAFQGVDYVIHAAALKHVPALEYNPTEAMKTNILGADNIVHAAIDMGVKKVIAISTDKAVNPINLYGATKLTAEKIFIASNDLSGRKVKFSIVRYGNVVGSRGSVIPFFLSLKKQGIKEFPLTDKRMTRFWITPEEGVKLVLDSLKEAEGGEIFVPIVPSMKIIDLIKAVEPNSKIKIIGIRPGEKIQETLISEDESRNTKVFKGMYVILPSFTGTSHFYKKYSRYKFVPPSFVYRSDLNKRWLNIPQLKKILMDFKIEKSNSL